MPEYKVASSSRMQVATAVGLTVSGGVTTSHTLTFKEKGIHRLWLVEISITGTNDVGVRDATIAFFAGGNATAFMSFNIDEFVGANYFGSAGTTHSYGAHVIGDEAAVHTLTGTTVIRGWRRFKDGLPVKDKLEVKVSTNDAAATTVINHLLVQFW